MKFFNKKSNESHIAIMNFDNIIQIYVREPVTYETFLEELKLNLSKDDFKYVKIHQLRNKIIKGSFIIIKGVRKSFNVLINEDYYYLSKNIIYLDRTRQVTLLSNAEGKFEITEKIISQQDGSRYRKYINNENKEVFSRKTALYTAYKLLRDLNGIKEFNDLIDLDFAWKDINVIKKEEFNPIIEDDKICLSQINPSDSIKIKYNIILKETNEIVGEIACIPKRDYFTYDGGIEYKIKDLYKNKGYATKALKLLLKYLETLNVEQLFIATEIDNIASKRVIAKNNGELILKGYLIDKKVIQTHNINEVEVYKLILKN
ncbi:MAG: GNAT family N-acetyltransferase [Bacilli bacterium]|nr:GNAT family N-acetyltransferase [Bacilli bacterium]